MPCTKNELFNFLQGSDITGESSYDVWMRLTGKDDPEAFLAYLRSGPKGDTGLSTYEQWLLQGNEGKSYQDFLNSLKGESGKSAYEEWKELDGNEDMTFDDFLMMIKGEPGKSTFQEWKDSPGNENGTINEFLELIRGKSVYDLWIEIGNKGNAHDFINSLRGDPGTNGAQGEQGPQGLPGKSAYEIWKELSGNENKTERDFIDRVLTRYQADFYQSNIEAPDYIKNKPVSLPASDVYSWAKQPNKPSYSFNEVGADPEGAADTALTESKKYIDLKINNETVLRESAIDNIMNIIKDYLSSGVLDHENNTIIHITSEERSRWNEMTNSSHNHLNSMVLANTTASYTVEDKDKLSNIENGAQVNTILGIKGDSEDEYRTGYIVISKSNIGLDKVENTSDIEKPISYAQQFAIDNVLSESKEYTNDKIKEEVNNRNIIISNNLQDAKSYTDTVTHNQTQLNNAALVNTLAEAKSYTDSLIDNETNQRLEEIANALAEAKSYTDQASASLLGIGTPETLNTFSEIAEVIESNKDTIQILNDAIGNKANSKDLEDHKIASNPHNITKSLIGLEEVENKSSATIRGEITTSDIVNALGYTPADTDVHYINTTYSLFKSGDAITLLGSDGTTTSVTINEAEYSLEYFGILASADELNFSCGLTSDIQTQLNEKQPTIIGAATTITENNLTPNRVLITDENGKVTDSDISVDELSQISNLDNIQTQLDDSIIPVLIDLVFAVRDIIPYVDITDEDVKNRVEILKNKFDIFDETTLIK